MLAGGPTAFESGACRTACHAAFKFELPGGGVAGLARGLGQRESSRLGDADGDWPTWGGSSGEALMGQSLTHQLVSRPAGILLGPTG
jgi:hypothetical protein